MFKSINTLVAKVKQKLTVKNASVAAVFAGFVALLTLQPAMAADLFDGAKTSIKDTAGAGSGIEMAVLGASLLGGVITGAITRNWVAGIAGFMVCIIFWNVAEPMVFGV